MRVLLYALVNTNLKTPGYSRLNLPVPEGVGDLQRRKNAFMTHVLRAAATSRCTRHKTTIAADRGPSAKACSKQRAEGSPACLPSSSHNVCRRRRSSSSVHSEEMAPMIPGFGAAVVAGGTSARATLDLPVRDRWDAHREMHQGAQSSPLCTQGCWRGVQPG